MPGFGLSAVAEKKHHAQLLKEARKDLALRLLEWLAWTDAEFERPKKKQKIEPFAWEHAALRWKVTVAAESQKAIWRTCSIILWQLGIKEPFEGLKKLDNGRGLFSLPGQEYGDHHTNGVKDRIRW